MSVVRAQTGRRWLIVGAAVALLLALPAAIAAIPAKSAKVALPVLSARIAASARQPYQGYAVATGSIGLPSLPQLGDVTDLFNGETSLRIWYASVNRWRVDTIASSVAGASERDVYQTSSKQNNNKQDGRIQTIWDSAQNEFTTIVGNAPVRLPRGADLAPPDLARRLMAAATETSSTQRSALPARRVGGISADGIRLRPTDPQTTVGQVDIWADPATGLPLEVDVTARGGRSPVLVSRMLDVTMTAPSDADTAVPVPTAATGNVVTTNPDVLDALSNLGLGALPSTALAGLQRSDDELGALSGIGAYGTGLRQIVAASIPGRSGFQAFRAAQDVGELVNFDDGMAVIVSTPLLNVVIVRSFQQRGNFIVAGLVQTDVLKQAAAELLRFYE